MHPCRPLVGLLVLALLTITGVSPLAGQGPRLPPDISTSRVTVQPMGLVSLPDSSPVKRTYWAEGGAIGALGGLLLSQLMTGFCDSGCHDDRTTFIMLVGGFIVGALVGGGIEKK